MKPVLQQDLKYPRLWFAAGLLLAGLVAVMSLLPPADLPKVHVWDKAEHAGAYFLLAFWFGSVIFRRDLPGLVIALLIFGAAIEVAQGAMGLGRQADWHDLLADGIGALLGVLLVLTPLGHWPHWVENIFPGGRRT
ncbi:MAG: VanZ family protein [Steroidobacteraceae bacterium]